MKSLQGFLLVASPALADPNFRKTVVLIVRHNEEEGALGLVLNRQTETTIRELWQRIGQEGNPSDAPLSLGGPCEGPLMALHADSAAAELEIVPGLYFTTCSSQLQVLAEQPPTNVRFFFGYSGWGARQLEAELASGAWTVEPAGSKHVFGATQGLWERATSEAEGWKVLSALNIKEVPGDPTLN